MKTVRTAVGIIMILIPMAMLMATPRVKLFHPPPDQYNIEQLWSVTLTNPDRDTYRVWLEGTITEATKGQVFWAQTDSFRLPPGPPMVLHYRDLHVVHQRNAPGYEEFVARTGSLPEGNYTFTVTLQPNYGSGSESISIRSMGPPRLVTPRDGDTVPNPHPQFVWTPPSPAQPGVTYDLKEVEVMRGQSPEEAMRANRPWFKDSGLTATSLTYPNSARALDTGSYAWIVIARAGGAAVASDIWSFCLGQGTPVAIPISLEDSIKALEKRLNIVVDRTNFAADSGRSIRAWHLDITRRPPDKSYMSVLALVKGNRTRCFVVEWMGCTHNMVNVQLLDNMGRPIPKAKYAGTMDVTIPANEPPNPEMFARKRLSCKVTDDGIDIDVHIGRRCSFDIILSLDI